MADDDPNDELSEQLEDLAEEQESASEEEDSFVEDTACRATILGCTVKRYADGRLAFHIKFRHQWEGMEIQRS